jgi:hypothetical protein
VQCCLLYWLGQGAVNQLCIPAGCWLFLAFFKSMGLCPIVCSAYHKNTNAKVELANCVIGDTVRLCTYTNRHKDDWDLQLPLAVFAIDNATSILGVWLTPFLIDYGVHPRLPLTAQAASHPDGKSPALYARRMR